MNKTLVFNDAEMNKVIFTGYIKYFDNGQKNMSFKFEDEDVYIKYNQICNTIKDLSNVRLHSEPI